jgi:hypothetical protein
MRRQIIGGSLLLVVSGVVLGATVFRTDIAQATGLAQSVVVSNTASQAVPVREQGRVSVTSTDDPARQAFAFFKNDSFGSTEDSHVVSFTVPNGKRLVIQSVVVNAGLSTGTGQKLVLTAVQARVNGNLEDYLMAPTFSGTTSGGLDIYTASQATTIYADGGTDVNVFATRNTQSGSGINLMNASVQGYVIDCSSSSPCN